MSEKARIDGREVEIKEMSIGIDPASNRPEVVSTIRYNGNEIEVKSDLMTNFALLQGGFVK